MDSQVLRPSPLTAAWSLKMAFVNVNRMLKTSTSHWTDQVGNIKLNVSDLMKCESLELSKSKRLYTKYFCLHTVE